MCEVYKTGASLYYLLGLQSKSYETAVFIANKLTKVHHQYWTAMPNSSGWYATNHFNPINWQGK
jgi:hypothetical protein